MEVDPTQVYYTSLAWGGHSSDSEIDVQAAHYVCEAMLKECVAPYKMSQHGLLTTVQIGHHLHICPRGSICGSFPSFLELLPIFQGPAPAS